MGVQTHRASQALTGAPHLSALPFHKSEPAQVVTVTLRNQGVLFPPSEIKTHAKHWQKSQVYSLNFIIFKSQC